MTIQMCQVSELLCLSTGAPTPIDIDDDGVFDGTLAVLVDDPADALSLTPSEWVGGFTAHCNLSMGSCVNDADCDAGKCALPDGRPSSTSCSVASQDCAGGETCLLVEICLEPAVYLHGVDIIPSESDTTGTDPVFVPQTYDVSAQCGGAPTAATTPTTAAAATTLIPTSTRVAAKAAR